MNDSHVIFLTHDSPASRRIAHAISETLTLSGIVIQQPRRPRRLERKKAGTAKWLLQGAIGRKMYGGLYRFRAWVTRSSLERKVLRIENQLGERALKELIQFCADRPDSWPQGPDLLKSHDLNSALSVQWCAERKPALILVYGTGILGKDIISIPRCGVLNVHSAMLPNYRGARSEFWLVLNRAFDDMGLSVHFVDENLDTGDIVAQQKCDVDPNIDPYRLRNRMVELAVRLLPQTAAEVLDKRHRPKPQGESSTPTYRIRDITLEKRIALLRLLGYDV